MDNTEKKKNNNGRKKVKHTPVFWGTFILLLLFWMMITWSFNYQFLLTGAVVCYFLTRFNYDLLITREERFKINGKTVILLAKYIYSMIVAIFLANIDVARIVLKRKMPVSPGIVKFRAKVDKDFTQVIFANSITLTPGTLTLDIEDGDRYVVHCLTRKNADDVANWDMENRLLELEKAGE